METFPSPEQPEEGVSFEEYMRNRPIRDHETQGAAAWRLAKWRGLRETGQISGVISISPEGEVKPYPCGLFVPPPLNESEARPYPLLSPEEGSGQ